MEAVKPQIDQIGDVARSADDAADSFCIFPFIGLNILPNGTAKPCCVFGTPLAAEGGEPMSVYEHSVTEIWNSSDMLEIRRAMLSGQPVSGCSYCYTQERAGRISRRREYTQGWLSGSDEFPNPTQASSDDIKAAARQLSLVLPPGPEWQDLDFGNLCNLKCRMCNSTYSSSIAGDPIHSRWAAPSPVPARWQGSGLVIAPRRVLGVIYDLLGQPDPSARKLTCWTYGDSGMRLRIAEATAVMVRVSGEKPDRHPLKISANNHVLFDDILPAGPWQQTFDLPLIKSHTEELELRFVSPVFFNHAAGHETGVGLEEIRLLRQTANRKGVALSRFRSGAQWFQRTDFLVEELLRHSDRLAKLKLIGGEPMLIGEVHLLMRHLVQSGVAERITLMCVTNATVYDDEWFHLASRFKSVTLVFSVDGFGQLNDYIRFPSKWSDIDDNIRRFLRLPNAHPRINMTVQAYNMLGIADLIAYCASLNLGFGYHVLEYPPYLGVATLPAAIRQLAADRLREFARKKGMGGGDVGGMQIYIDAAVLESAEFSATF